MSLTRRQLFEAAAAVAALATVREARAATPEPTVGWTSDGPYVSFPQKLPLIRLTDRPVQLETPRSYFATAITPNDAFYVRWHLPNLPTTIDLAAWRIRVEGHVDAPFELSMADLLDEEPVDVVAVNQCSGNSRSRFDPRVTGGQWGNGAMGCARWTGVPLRRVLERARPRAGALQVQLQGLDTGNGPEGRGSHSYRKSLDLDDPVLDHALVAYAMNGEPLPLLNGFPARLVVPGWFATYWVKALGWIRVLDATDENFWMNPGYRVPDGEGTKPISAMPIRSFLVAPDGASKLVAGMPVTLRGIAFGGAGPAKVEWSADDGATWSPATLGEDLGPYAFRTWEARWTPKAGRHVVAVRATDRDGVTQPDEPIWNGGGYLWNRIERQELVVGGLT